MARSKTNGRKTPKQVAIERTADAFTMLSATQRANERERDQRARAYFYGNIGDSIERRASPGMGMLGNGNDSWDGTFGPGGTWSAVGGGSYLGTGLLNGYGRMFSGATGGLNGYGGGFTYLKRFSSQSAFNHAVIAQCMLAYLGYGVVRNIIDLYADFATEGLDIDHPDASVRNFYRTWATKVNLEERVYSMFLNLFVSGNVFVHRRWATLDEDEKRAMKRAKAAENVGDMLIIRGKSKDRTIYANESGFIDWYLTKGEIHLKNDDKNGKTVATAPPAPSEEELPENPEKRIPWGYTFLNPLQMEIRGRRIRGDHYWIMAVDKKDTLEIARGLGMSTRQELGTTEINLPREFLSRVKKYAGPGAGYSAEVKLSKEELSIIQAPGKWDWFDWAVPFCFPALQALAFKDCLRNMELRAAHSVINSVTLYKLGNIEKGMPAEDEHFERLADMLQMPGQALNILWTEAIEAEVIQPDVKGLFDIGKHESANQDILTALGVPEVLLGGKGGNFSNSYIAVATVLEKLESYRMKVNDWLMGEMKIIADAMGFQKLPTVRFGRTSLKDEKAYQTFLLGLYDRGICSANTLLEEIDSSAEIQASQMKEEKEKLREKDIFEPKGPFVKEPKLPPGAAKPGGKVPPKPNGRPGGSSTGPTGKQSNPRPPKGRNVAELLELQDALLTRGRAMFDQLEAFTSDRILKAKARENPGLKHLKQLRAQEKEELEQLIYNVFSHMPAPPNDDPLKDDFIINMLQSNAVDRVKADVLEIYANKISEYSSRFQKQPTREMRRQFMVSAWTQCAIMRHIESKPDLLSV
jgi:hypothetical protein